MHSLYGIVKGDFYQRLRQFSFIAMVAMSIVAVFWFVPTSDATRMQVLIIQPDRFVQGGNSSWISVASALGLVFFLPLAGFFYFRNTIFSDEKLGVYQLISVSTTGNAKYFFSKFVSGTITLYCFSVVVIVGSLFQVLLHFSGEQLSIYAFLSPFLFLLFTLPLTVAISLLFQSLKPLRGVLGSVLFLVGYIFVTTQNMRYDNANVFFRTADIAGLSFIHDGINQAVLIESGQPLTIMKVLGGGIEFQEQTRQLTFSGFPISAATISSWIGMFCSAIAITLLAAQLYRLSNYITSLNLFKRKKAKKLSMTIPQEHKIVVYAPVAHAQYFNILRYICAELKLLIKGRPNVWYIVAIAGIIACCFAPIKTVQTLLLPLMLLWFVNVFSALGCREYQNDMLKNIAVIDLGRMKQVVCSWISAIFITTIIAIPLIIRLLISGDFLNLLGCFAGVVFLPSLALFCGELSKSSRLFEVVFIIITYTVINGVAPMMYLGSTQLHSIQPIVYLILGLALAAGAISKRLNASV